VETDSMAFLIYVLGSFFVKLQVILVIVKFFWTSM
jgi:hypothetical protein